LFVALVLKVAPDFDTHPKVRKLLAGPSLSPSRRLDGLETALTDLESAQSNAALVQVTAATGLAGFIVAAATALFGWVTFRKR
jgi:hypothetical protein